MHVFLCPLLCAQALQKRLLQKSEEVADRDMRLKEAAETKAELEAAAARLPGPGAAEQLVLCQVGSLVYALSRAMHHAQANSALCRGHCC